MMNKCTRDDWQNDQFLTWSIFEPIYWNIYRFEETLIDHQCVGRLVKLMNAHWSIFLLSSPYPLSLYLYLSFCFSLSARFFCFLWFVLLFDCALFHHSEPFTIFANHNCNKSIRIAHLIRSIRIPFNFRSLNWYQSISFTEKWQHRNLPFKCVHFHLGF